MKISEMTNDQATEAMIRIAGPISNICDDEDMLAILDEIANSQKIPVVKMIAKILPKFTAFGLQKHKEDIYEIISALHMIPVAEVGGMNFAETLRIMRESYDDILAGFFTSSAPAKKVEGAELA